MRSRAWSLLAGAVLLVTVASVAIGLASPDGTVSGVEPVNQGPRPTGSSPAPSADAATDGADDEDDEATADTPPGPDLAPAAVAGTWPGAPDGVVAADGSTDWCGEVRTTGDGRSRAESALGRASVDAAACAAVSFVLDRRYSRLSLPRADYAASDFDAVLASLDPRTVSGVYRPRIAQFVAAPRSDEAGESLGLVLFTARGTPRGADHATAGPGHVFYGPAFSTRGYADRAAWINPSWSPVTVRLVGGSSRPRLEARLTASASMPVWATSGEDAMLTVPTRASFTMTRDDDGRWLISGWTINRGAVSFAPLAVD